MKRLSVVYFLISIGFLLYANESSGYIVQKNGVLYCQFKNQWKPKISIIAVDYWVNIAGKWNQYVTMNRLSSVSNWNYINMNIK